MTNRKHYTDKAITRQRPVSRFVTSGPVETARTAKTEETHDSLACRMVFGHCPERECNE